MNKQSQSKRRLSKRLAIGLVGLGVLIVAAIVSLVTISGPSRSDYTDIFGSAQNLREAHLQINKSYSENAVLEMLGPLTGTIAEEPYGKSEKKQLELAKDVDNEERRFFKYIESINDKKVQAMREQYMKDRQGLYGDNADAVAHMKHRQQSMRMHIACSGLYDSIDGGSGNPGPWLEQAKIHIYNCINALEAAKEFNGFNQYEKDKIKLYSDLANDAKKLYDSLPEGSYVEADTIDDLLKKHSESRSNIGTDSIILADTKEYAKAFLEDSSSLSQIMDYTSKRS